MQDEKYERLFGQPRIRKDDSQIDGIVVPPGVVKGDENKLEMPLNIVAQGKNKRS